MKRENYKRYGFGGPRKIVDPKWVKELPKDNGQWTMEQEVPECKKDSYFSKALISAQ